MRRNNLVLILLAVMAGSAQALPVTIELSRVGNPGNKSDPTVATDGSSGFGSVAYAYSIGTEDVTLTQYTAFLNAVAKADPRGLYNPALGTGDNIKGIARTGTSGKYVYTVIGNGQNPVTFVSWLDAARFCNWLQNGQPTGSEGPNTTETGAYTLGANATGLETKNANAKWWIPSENEWYKAAYYDPTKGGTGGYWSYATRSATVPGNDYKTPAAGKEANFINAKGDYCVTGTNELSNKQNYLTPVKYFTDSASYYGTYDQAGDVYQWNDGFPSKSLRGIRGGSWDADAIVMESISCGGRNPATAADNQIGFRVASSTLP